MKVGDKVVVSEYYSYTPGFLKSFRKDYGYEGPLVGKIVTLKSNTGGSYGIKFPCSHKGFHDCHGSGPDGYCWYVPIGHLKKIDDSPKECSVTGEMTTSFAIIDNKVFSTKFLESLV